MSEETYNPDDSIIWIQTKLSVTGVRNVFGPYLPRIEDKRLIFDTLKDYCIGQNIKPEDIDQALAQRLHTKGIVKIRSKENPHLVKLTLLLEFRKDISNALKVLAGPSVTSLYTVRQLDVSGRELKIDGTLKDTIGKYLKPDGIPWKALEKPSTYLHQGEAFSKAKSILDDDKNPPGRKMVWQLEQVNRVLVGGISDLNGFVVAVVTVTEVQASAKARKEIIIPYQ
ncbi:hypothetical protein BKA66DRAFT_443773 [Pyrenochaeta sp. MPI-SDFR-AT-0127]|nr:hypothetical protein BKA66DRAFT_443773 [Pyrenochaeta sp. MPI-SDFR-AT-0127]